MSLLMFVPPSKVSKQEKGIVSCSGHNAFFITLSHFLSRFFLEIYKVKAGSFLSLPRLKFVNE